MISWLNALTARAKQILVGYFVWHESTRTASKHLLCIQFNQVTLISLGLSLAQLTYERLQHCLIFGWKCVLSLAHLSLGSLYLKEDFFFLEITFLLSAFIAIGWQQAKLIMWTLGSYQLAEVSAPAPKLYYSVISPSERSKLPFHLGLQTQQGNTTLQTACLSNIYAAWLRLLGPITQVQPPTTRPYNTAIITAAMQGDKNANAGP